MAFDPQNYERCLQLIREVRNPSIPDDEASIRLTELEGLLSYPHVSDLLFHQTPSLTDEEVIERALQYRPFTL